MRRKKSVPRRDARGLSDSVQIAILVPLLTLLLFGVIDFALLMHAQSAANEAARAGAEAQALLNAEPDVGSKVATDIGEDAGLKNISISTIKADGLVTVKIEADAPIPFPKDVKVQAQYSMPIEGS